MQSRLWRALCGRAKPRMDRSRTGRFPPSALRRDVRAGAHVDNGRSKFGIHKSRKAHSFGCPCVLTLRSSMKWMIRCHLWRTTDFSRASSDLKPLPTERLPTRLADECERAAAKAPRRSVEDRGHEFLCTARGRWPPRREVGGGRSGVCGQRRPARSHDRGPRRDGGEKGSARFFWALLGR